MQGHTDGVAGEIPLAEAFGYSTTLRSMTPGQGTFSMEFAVQRHAAQVARQLRCSPQSVKNWIDKHHQSPPTPVSSLPSRQMLEILQAAHEELHKNGGKCAKKRKDFTPRPARSDTNIRSADLHESVSR